VTNVPAKNLVLTEVYNSRLFKQFSEKENVDIIQDRDVICAYEVLTSENEDEQANIRYYPVLLRTEEVVTQQYSASGSYTRRNLFGYPFVLSVPHASQVTYKQLYALIYHRLQRFLNLPSNRVVYYEDEAEEGGSSNNTDGSAAGEEETERADDNNDENSENNPNDEEATQLMDDEDLVDSDDIDSDASDLDSDEEAELLRLRAQKKQQKVLQLKQQRLKPQSNGRVPIFVLQSSDSYGSGDSVSFHNSSQPLNLVDRTPIAVTWSMHSQYHYYNKEAENEFEKHASSRKQHHNEETSVRLDKCIDLFTMTEKLGPEDPWYCSRCKEFQQATKKFDIWKAPPILVVHLKRFSYRNKYWREKLETYVDYPIHDLDLSAYVQGPQEVPPVYELYAVSNHYGSLGGGHYTAYGKNKKNHKWYKFDDSSVGEIDESKSQTSSAYVLFYRRKDTFTPEELAAATAGAAAATTATTTTTTTTTSSNNNNDVDSNDDDTNTANSSSGGAGSSAAAEGEPSEDAEMRD
jgi:ubiquitin carboxyl-terminal hydrolase 4/11/15